MDANTEFGIDIRLVDVPWGNETRRALVARSNTIWQSLSWATGGGGRTTTSTYCCLEVRNSDLPIEVPPEDIIARFIAALDVSAPVTTLTSANVAAFCTGSAREQDCVAFAIVTAGFANALRIGELLQPSTGYQPHTINIACWLNHPLSFEAQLEALSIIAQARTLAVLEAQIESCDKSGFATGTGTDCIALFTKNTHNPNTDSLASTGPTQAPRVYAGMHTSVGRVIGKAVCAAMRQAASAWTTKHGARGNPNIFAQDS